LIDEEARKRGQTVDQLVSTDDSLLLEYSTPRGNADDRLKVAALVDSLKGLSAQPLPVTAQTDAERLHAKLAWHVGREEFAIAAQQKEALPQLDAAAPLAKWLTENPPPP
jgi:hypothetical protein